MHIAAPEEAPEEATGAPSPAAAFPAKPTPPVLPERSTARRLISAARRAWEARVSLTIWCVGLGVGYAASSVLVSLGVAKSVAVQMVALGFDADRAHLIAALCLALLAAAVGSFLSLRRGAAWLGSTLAFAFGYLWPFYIQAQHPTLGPDGRPQVLLAGSLLRVILALAALAILFAGAGAVLGEACGRLILSPLAGLGAHLIRRLRGAANGAPSPSLPALARTLGVVALLLGALALGLPSAGAILSYGASVDLYQNGQSLTASARGSVEEGTYPSPALGGAERRYSIYLPPTYYTTDGQTQRYPVVYLLHGVPGGPADWFSAAHAGTTADALLTNGLMREAILVSPDGNGPTYPVSAWVNSYDKRQRMEDAIATDLVSYIDAHYRTRADAADRAIGGLSEGGFGAVNIGLHRPDIFSRVMSLGGFFTADGSPAFGRGAATTDYRHYNSPTAYLETSEGHKAGSRLTFVIGVGKADGTYYKLGMDFAKELTTLGMSVRVIQTDGGHSWKIWEQQLSQSLPLLAPPKVTVHRAVSPTANPSGSPTLPATQPTPSPTSHPMHGL